MSTGKNGILYLNLKICWNMMGFLENYGKLQEICTMSELLLCPCADELSFEVCNTVHSSLLYGTCGEHNIPLTPPPPPRCPWPSLRNLWTCWASQQRGIKVADRIKFAKSVHLKMGKLSWSICVGPVLSQGSLEVDRRKLWGNVMWKRTQ